jgi:hypothetical protein
VLEKAHNFNLYKSIEEQGSFEHCRLFTGKDLNRVPSRGGDRAVQSDVGERILGIVMTAIIGRR